MSKQRVWQMTILREKHRFIPTNLFNNAKTSFGTQPGKPELLRGWRKKALDKKQGNKF